MAEKNRPEIGDRRLGARKNQQESGLFSVSSLQSAVSNFGARLASAPILETDKLMNEFVRLQPIQKKQLGSEILVVTVLLRTFQQCLDKGRPDQAAPIAVEVVRFRESRAKTPADLVANLEPRILDCAREAVETPGAAECQQVRAGLHHCGNGGPGLGAESYVAAVPSL